MSSRNQRLSSSARQLAGCIFQALKQAAAAWNTGETRADKLEAIMRQTLTHAEIEIEYVALRHPETWQPYTSTDTLAPQALIAITLERIRLIDNLNLSYQSLT